MTSSARETKTWLSRPWHWVRRTPVVKSTVRRYSGSSARGRRSRIWKAGVEGLHPLERAAVREALGGVELAGEQPVLERGEFGGEPGRPGVFGAVGADEGVVGDDDPLVLRVAEQEGAVVAVAAEEAVLPAGGRPGLPGAVDGAVGHGRSTAAP
ncbi:hypothetical protein RKD27_002590 [Streptomyces sp. SAI-126]